MEKIRGKEVAKDLIGVVQNEVEEYFSERCISHFL